MGTGDRRFGSVGSGNDDRFRGQVSTIGFVLLLSFTLLVAGSVVAIGAQAIGGAEDQAKGLRAEQSFTHLDSRAAQVALGESSTQTLRTGLSDEENGALAVEYTGTITVTKENQTTLLEQRLGTVRYERGGTTVAFQGGGTWRGTGRESRMLSPPELHYHDGTLTLPVVVVSPGEPGDDDRLRLAAKDGSYDLGLGRVENEVITVSVTSEYYAGWAQYFRTRVPASTVTVDHANETVTAELGRATFPVRFDSAVVAQTGDVEVSSGNAKITGSVVAGGSITTGGGGSIDGSQTEYYHASETPIDPIIERRVENATSNPDDYESIPSDRTLEGGNRYYLSGDLDESLEVDLGDGNVTLVHEGDIDLGSGENVHVINAAGDRNFKLFTTGNLTLADGKMYVGPESSSDVATGHLQVYGTSDMEIGISGGDPTYFEGVVYAPRLEDAPGENEAFASSQSQCDLGDHYADTCIATGSAAVDGAIVGGSMAVKQGTTVNYDTDLSSLSTTLRTEETVAPPLSFLHVSVNQIRVDGAARSGSAALDSPTPTIEDVTITEADSGEHEVTIDWTVQGAELEKVTVTAVDAVARERSSSTVDASGSSASGTTTLSFDSESSDTYQVIVAATNGDGNTVSDGDRTRCENCGEDGNDGGNGNGG